MVVVGSSPNSEKDWPNFASFGLLGITFLAMFCA
jgi:hypothetical protein